MVMLKNEPKIIVSDLNVFYGNKQAIFDINMSINAKEVTAFIGPSGCGKSTLLRCFNRMNDLIDICKITGNIKLDDLEVYSKKIDIVRLRTRVGMVFQKPNPFPKSIYDNVAYGPKIHGMCPPAAESYCTNRRLSWQTVRMDKHTVLSGVQLPLTSANHSWVRICLKYKSNAIIKGQSVRTLRGRNAYLKKPKVHFPKGLSHACGCVSIIRSRR